jgi:hypothetical protein
MANALSNARSRRVPGAGAVDALVGAELELDRRSSAPPRPLRRVRAERLELRLRLRPPLQQPRRSAAVSARSIAAVSAATCARTRSS